jgi:hypothetical protein
LFPLLSPRMSINIYHSELLIVVYSFTPAMQDHSSSIALLVVFLSTQDLFHDTPILMASQTIYCNTSSCTVKHHLLPSPYFPI